ncbi:MAG: formimidoylglutamase [Bacteroidota bacterium]
MDISPFFHAIDSELFPATLCPDPDMWGRRIQTHEGGFPSWKEAHIVLMGATAPEEESEEESAPHAIRRQLYQLSVPDSDLKVVDLGDLIPKESQESYHERLAYVMNVLLTAGKTVLIMGGRQELVYGQYMGYEELEQEIEYVQIDARFDLEDSEWALNERSYNHKVFLHQPEYLFNFTNLGYQRYFVSETQLQVLKNLNYAAIRYGELAGNIEEVEPYLRMADMVSMDLSSIRSSEAPGVFRPSPGGFTAEEACRMARYAGLGYQVKSFSLTELAPQHDQRDQSSLLSALILWYFVQGYAHRKSDAPNQNRSNLRKYTVRLHASIEAIHFYCHPTTGRWWMEVPYQHSLGKKKPKTKLVPCSQLDYEFAKGDDIPERWWLAYNKLS